MLAGRATPPSPQLAGPDGPEHKHRDHTHDGRDDAGAAPGPGHLSLPPPVIPPGRPQHRPDRLGSLEPDSTAGERIPARGHGRDPPAAGLAGPPPSPTVAPWPRRR